MAGGEDGVLQTSGSAAELGHLGGREVEGRRRLVEEEDAEAPRNREAVRVVEVHDAPPPPCRGGRSGPTRWLDYTTSTKTIISQEKARVG